MNRPIDLADAKKPGISRLPHHTHVLPIVHPAERLNRPAGKADQGLYFSMKRKKSLLESSTITSLLLAKLWR
jgi:hypothetical protein